MLLQMRYWDQLQFCRQGHSLPNECSKLKTQNE
uniref:Uncharacterized protein n=1 Tax=Arundo donax TaxID=35708 RepID=A0A0A9FKX2_ARUDO